MEKSQEDTKIDLMKLIVLSILLLAISLTCIASLPFFGHDDLDHNLKSDFIKWNLGEPIQNSTDC